MIGASTWCVRSTLQHISFCVTIYHVFRVYIVMLGCLYQNLFYCCDYWESHVQFIVALKCLFPALFVMFLCFVAILNCSNCRFWHMWIKIRYHSLILLDTMLGLKRILIRVTTTVRFYSLMHVTPIILQNRFAGARVRSNEPPYLAIIFRDLNDVPAISVLN